MRSARQRQGGEPDGTDLKRLCNGLLGEGVDEIGLAWKCNGKADLGLAPIGDGNARNCLAKALMSLAWNGHGKAKQRHAKL